VSRPGLPGLQAEKRGHSGHSVQAAEKVPQFGVHKYLILLTLVRWGGADLAVRDRRRAASVPHLYRWAAGRSGGGAVKLHMEIG
jgi:hypothetical protein